MLLILGTARLHADCPGFGPQSELPNVTWSVKDSISGCPAGDSIAFSPPSPRPAKIRIFVTYTNECLQPHPRVPPDSIWVTTAIVSGNPRTNNQPGKIFADDSTNALGQTRFTIPSLSGCGTLKLRLFVSGVAQGFKNVKIRSVDLDGDGRVSAADHSLTECGDLNFDGQANLTDAAVSAASVDHWFRLVMHGTPVLRTNLEEYGYGAGGIAWSPDGSQIAFSSHTQPTNDCQIQIVDSTPSPSGDVSRPFSFPPLHSLDYNPSWAPRGDFISFDRDDRKIFTKGVQGQPDTTEFLVVNATGSIRVTEGAISPDGKMIAYSHLIPGSSGHIYAVSITGGTPVQISSGSGILDGRPQWSPDGTWIYFSRLNLGTGVSNAYRIPAAGGNPELVYGPSQTDARLPSPSPDGLTVALHSASVGTIRVPRAMESAMIGSSTIPAIATLTSQPSFQGYPCPSPDGTRIAYIGNDANGVSQLWATRRNMNRPPHLSSIGDKVVAQGANLTFTISASNPEWSAPRS